MFSSKEHDVEKVKNFVEENAEAFRYTICVDKENHALENIYKRGGYQAIPCVVIAVDNVITYVGSASETFEAELINTLKIVSVEE
ncbi:hypothetical protein BGZ58_004924 [Dissophora ornata]|nr:hypothetical protein BGZ58_004924 [Dissophora ornata]